MVFARHIALSGLAAALLLGSIAASADEDYPWMPGPPARTIESVIAAPAGFTRIEVPSGSFAGWLRGLPLAPEGTTLSLYDGRPLLDQSSIAAVLDIDTGTSDLQQCADAIMRLRAEFLYSRGLLGAIGFALLDGQPYPFTAYSRGVTPKLDGDRVQWERAKPRGSAHRDLRGYLDLLFGFAGTQSLARELQPVASFGGAEIGDAF